MKRSISRRTGLARFLVALLAVGGLCRDGRGPALAAEKGEDVARPGELGETSMSGAYRFYLGTTHAHSGYSGDHAKTVATKLNQGVADYDRHTPIEVFEKARANGYDYYFMTDHSSPEQNEF